ncbi:MAG TPA: NAD(P)-dependent oxidoreductase [Thermoanaerobaculia bacterium]|nr:NAD(P)-dependent oxidoreductase [Thermoanaerobaculia bacterium]
MPSLRGRTLFVSGASRGIGKAIALRAAADGANVVVASKTAEPHPKLPGTIYSAAAEIEAAGGRALAVQMDIRDEAQVYAAVAAGVERFGGIDVLVNNASAISLTGTLETPMKKFDLMWGVNARGTFLCSQACIPHLKKSPNPHILNLSPPLNLNPRWFARNLAYTMSKYGMSLCVLGMAEELKADGVAVNALWPRTAILTAALQALGGAVRPELCRKPEIVADAAHLILTRDSRCCSGNFYLDDEVLAAAGITDLEPYAVQPGHELFPDFFLD